MSDAAPSRLPMRTTTTTRVCRQEPNLGSSSAAAAGLALDQLKKTAGAWHSTDLGFRRHPMMRLQIEWSKNRKTRSNASHPTSAILSFLATEHNLSAAFQKLQLEESQKSLVHAASDLSKERRENAELQAKVKDGDTRRISSPRPRLRTWA